MAPSLQGIGVACTAAERGKRDFALVSRYIYSRKHNAKRHFGQIIHGLSLTQSTQRGKFGLFEASLVQRRLRGSLQRVQRLPLRQREPTQAGDEDDQWFDDDSLSVSAAEGVSEWLISEAS